MFASCCQFNVSSLSLNLSRDPILLLVNLSRKDALFASRGILVVEPVHLPALLAREFANLTGMKFLNCKAERWNIRQKIG